MNPEIHLTPLLKVVKLDSCGQLDNPGFLELLNVTGKKLTVLDISRLNITWDGLAELDIHLNNLQRLNMDSCKSPTNQKIMEILHITGGNLQVGVYILCKMFFLGGGGVGWWRGKKEKKKL